MKKICILSFFVAFVLNAYSQTKNEKNKYEVILPDIQIENTKKRTITFFELEEDSLNFAFSIEKILNLPEDVKTSKELFEWLKKDIEKEVPKYHGYRLAHIDNQIAYFEVKKDDYVHEEEVFLKLCNEGYVFRYSVSGIGEKEKLYTKYYKKYIEFLKNIKIN
jgi:DNA gyrase/topoisomerase IV subunit A